MILGDFALVDQTVSGSLAQTAFQSSNPRNDARSTLNGGYRGASLHDLLKVMSIGEGSFYNTFRSKRRLYLECLRHYNDTVSRRRLDALRAPPSAKAGIRAFFKAVLDELDNPKTPSMCMLAGSVSREVLAELNSRLRVSAC